MAPPAEDLLDGHSDELVLQAVIAGGEVRSRLTEAHDQLLDYLDTGPDELLHSRERFRTRLWWDTYSHYPMHAEHIREWRERVGM